MHKKGPIGVFDSGYGGLSVLREIVARLPQYDYIYLGDNARAPYGARSFETIYQYTLECIQALFSRGCRLVIVACNTASARALRNIQQNDLPNMEPGLRVLGVIRPTTEIVGDYSKTRKVGIFGTSGTVASQSYPIEIEKFFPDIVVSQEACPMWVPLVENNEFDSPGADYFVKKHIDKLLAIAPDIDLIVLGCTHYPLLEKKILQYLPEGIHLISQGRIVASSLEDYLARHTEMEIQCQRGSSRSFLTTDSTEIFDSHARIFFGEDVRSIHVELGG